MASCNLAHSLATPPDALLECRISSSKLRLPHQPLYRSSPHLTLPQRHGHCRQSLPPVRASSRREDGSLSSLEIEVPTDQRPVNELAELKASSLYSWATLEFSEYAKRLVIVWGGAFSILGGPIAFQTFDPADQPLEFFLSASTGSLLVVAAVSLRIYLGWKYVSDRLMTATLEYEETGWYDGQFFVKPPEILTRDRLLGTYETRPVMARLRRTLQATGASLAITAVALAVCIQNGSDVDGVYGRGRGPVQVTPDGVIFSTKVRSIGDLKTDDEAAEAEAQAQGGVPGYCQDRYFKSVAGGERVCDKFERGRRGR